MAFSKLLISIMFLTVVQSKDLQRSRRQNSGLCDVMGYTDTNRVQCYCKSTVVGTTSFVFIADCMVADNNIPPDDDIWKQFASISTIERLSFSSKGNSIVSYVPTLALKSIPNLLIVSIIHGNIKKIHPYAFGNLTNLQELKLSGNEIQIMEVNAFANHPNLTSIQLDNNQIVEIKRNVFKNLPRLQELFLINNNITTIHDRAFVHLGGLKVLELDKNSIFVLTNETFSGLSNLTRLELSGNNLEVIGDYTFAALRSLFLSNNKIKMIDEKAFHGVVKLESLSLAHNKLKELSNPRIFAGLPSLLVLDLKANGLKELSYETIAPIMHNLYSIGSGLGFEDNEFSCDCKLNWFMALKNHTKNKHLKDKLNNLMCYPSPKLHDEYKRILETEKSNAEEENGGKEDYDDDYYDEKSMGGRLFFSDLPENIIPCPDGFHPVPIHVPTIHSTRIPAYTTTYATPSPKVATERSTPAFQPQLQTRTTPEFESKQITSISPAIYATEEVVDDSETSKTQPVDRMLIETEERASSYDSINKHSFGITAETASPDVSTADNYGKISVSTPTGSTQGNGIRSRDIMQGDSHTITQNVNKDQAAPKSMSHVHTSKASCLHLTILSLVIPTCHILASVRFKM